MTFVIVDPAPEAEDDINATEVDTPVNGNVLTNDSDDNPADSLAVVDPATGEAATGPVTVMTANGGTVVINSDGSYEYTPADGFVGEDTFDYTAIDTFGKTDDAAVSIEVRDTNAPVDPTDPTTFNNTPPVATDDDFTSFANMPLESSVMSNDSDPDGDVIGILDPVSGEEAAVPQTIMTDQGDMVTLNPDGTFEYTPPADFIGEDSFDYAIIDPSGATDEATVTLSVVADPDPNANDAPVAGDDALVGTKNDPVEGNLLDNDTDPNGDSPLTITDVAGQDPTAGPITILDENGDPAGTLEVDPITGETVFTPEDDFVGTVQVPYTITDPSGEEDTATLTVTVFDNPPVAQDDVTITEPGQPVDGNLLTNDQDPNPSDDLDIAEINGTPITDPTQPVTTTVTDPVTGDPIGELTIDPETGDYTFEPTDSEFAGTVEIPYAVTDEEGNSDEATLTIEVIDTDPPVDPTDPSTFDNVQPVATDDDFTTFNDMPLSSSVLSNDVDPDGDVLEVTEVNGQPVDPTTPVEIFDPADPTSQVGELTINPDGTFTFTPTDPTFQGEPTFEYTITDPSGATDTATVTLAINADSNPDENDAPEAGEDVLAAPVGSGPLDGNLLSNDSDPNGDTVSVSEINGQDPSAGPITLTDPVTGDPIGTLVVDPATGEVTFTPEDDFVGTVEVPYTITDGDLTNDATLTLTVLDTPPVAEDDTLVTDGNQPANGNLLLNDSDQNPNDELTVVDPTTGEAATQPVVLTTDAGGTVVINPDGTYEYTPPIDFVGEDSFDYAVVDPSGKDDTATATIEVREPNEAADPTDPTTFMNDEPIATDDSFDVVTDQPLTSSVISNDGDPDGDVIAIADPSGDEATTPQTIITDQGGMVTLNPDGTFEYTPPADFIGEDSFDYSVVDPSGATDDATVTLTVTPPSDPSENQDPSAGDDTLIGTKNDPIEANLLDNDTDPEGDTPVITDVAGQDPTVGPIEITDPITGDVVGELTVDPTTGETVFTPEDDFVGTVQVPYTITDPVTGEEDTATITLGVFDPTPEAVDDINGTSINTPTQGNVLTNDSSDPDDELVIGDGSGNPLGGTTSFPTDQGGTLTINPDGSYIYDPPADFVGEDTITIQILDENGNPATSELVIDTIDPTVDPLNTQPIASDDNFSLISDPDSPSTLSSTLAANDSDPDEEPIVVADAGGVPPGTTFVTANGGMVLVNPDGTFDYTPAAGFIGEDTFNYTIIDSTGETDTATVEITVTPDDNGDENNPPASSDDFVVTPKNVPIGGEQLLNDIDPEGDDLMVISMAGIPVVPGTVVPTVQGGTIVFGSFFYTPPNDYVGTDSVEYTVTDGNGGTSTSTIYIVIVDEPPVVGTDVNSTSANTPVEGNILTNDVSNPDDDLVVADENGNPLTGPTTIEASNGELVINPDGSYVYTPNPDFAGDDVIEVQVCDENGNCEPATITIRVADFGVAKDVVGDPVLLSNGNHEVTYQLVVANLGSYDVADLSLVEELADQFGDSFVSAGDLRIVSPAGDLGSNIAIDTDWDGDSVTELIAAGSTLAAGDSFTLVFRTEIDASEFDSTADTANSVVGSGNAIDENGNTVTNANGDPVVVSEQSDGGTDPQGTNAGEPGDTFGSDDPTLLLLPSIGVAKQAGDAVENGLNWDVTFTLFVENNGTTVLNNLSIIDDVQGLLGDALVGISDPTIQNFSGTGTPPVVNNAWANDTTQSLISGGLVEVGDTFQVTFTVTLDPDATGESTSLSNSAIGSGQPLDQNGDPLTDSNGDPITVSDVTDNGTDPNSENGEELTTDGVYANDSSAIKIADLSIAKAVVGEPEILWNGNAIVRFQLIVENTGTLHLANLSLLEDIGTQFGDVLIDAGNLELVASPTNSLSSISLNSAAWNGINVLEMIDTSADNFLAIGDSFTVEFTTQIDALSLDGPLENQVTGQGDAVDDQGTAVLGQSGDQLVANDVSDNGTDPNSENGEDNGDGVFGNDPTLVNIEIDPTGYFYDVDTGEILTGGFITVQGPGPNTVNLVDNGLDGDFQFFGTQDGLYVVTINAPEGYRLVTDSLSDIAFDPTGQGNPVVLGATDANGDGILDDRTLTTYYLTFDLEAGDPLVLQNNLPFQRFTPGVSGNPPNFPGFAPIFRSVIGNQISNFLGSPGTIYSGTPINSNANPLSLDSGRPVTGGYSTAGTGAAGGDGCDAVDTNPCGQIMIVDPAPEMIIQEGCGCGVPQSHLLNDLPMGSIMEPVQNLDPLQVEGSEELAEDAPTEEDLTEEALQIQSAHSGRQAKPNFMERFTNWLSRKSEV